MQAIFQQAKAANKNDLNFSLEVQRNVSYLQASHDHLAGCLIATIFSSKQ
jgi:hypothetical protein